MVGTTASRICPATLRQTTLAALPAALQTRMIPTSNPSRLILASSSAYRKELLSRLRLPFEVAVPDLDEHPLPGESPSATALRLAQAKAQAVLDRFPGSLVIGSDQVATLDGAQIGKPGNHANALRQLQTMRGREVIFHTALCLLDGRQAVATAEVEDIRTLVTVRDLPDAELDAYLRLEQPYDCAGSAKNEGLGIAILDSINTTDPTALTGLPLIALTGMLRRAGVAFFTI